MVDVVFVHGVTGMLFIYQENKHLKFYYLKIQYIRIIFIIKGDPLGTWVQGDASGAFLDPTFVFLYILF